MDEKEVDQKKEETNEGSIIDNGGQMDNYDTELIEKQSIDMLTLREGFDYDNNKQNSIQQQYPSGYNESDDLNQDGVIDEMEH